MNTGALFSSPNDSENHIPIGWRARLAQVQRLSGPSRNPRPKRLLRCERTPPALWARNVNLIKKTMNSEAVFEQLKKFRKSGFNWQANWLAGWLAG